MLRSVRQAVREDWAVEGDALPGIAPGIPADSHTAEVR